MTFTIFSFQIVHIFSIFLIYRKDRRFQFSQPKFQRPHTLLVKQRILKISIMNKNYAMIAEVQADFGINLLREVSKGGASTVLSPISVAIALSQWFTLGQRTRLPGR
jgi:hypothetical protein